MLITLDLLPARALRMQRVLKACCKLNCRQTADLAGTQMFLPAASLRVIHAEGLEDVLQVQLQTYAGLEEFGTIPLCCLTLSCAPVLQAQLQTPAGLDDLLTSLRLLSDCVLFMQKGLRMCCKHSCRHMPVLRRLKASLQPAAAA